MDFLKRNVTVIVLIVGLLAVYFLFIRRPTTGLTHPHTGEELELVTLLPKDGIPSIDNPTFYTAAEADGEYLPGELVLGVSINGDHRAYSTSLLNSHEIVNDTVGGEPIAVTW